MKVLYLDCYSGISGDMFLGALFDAGLEEDCFKRELSKLNLKGYRIKIEKKTRGEILSTKFDVIIDKRAPDKSRTLKEIIILIQRSRLEGDVKERSCAIFKSLAEAESRIHGVDIKKLHFHEVGSLDSIIDVVGAAAALKIMKIEKVYSSQVFIGTGATIKTKAGVLPVPAPAALNLLRGKPLARSGINAELVTPTGAALLANLVDAFEALPPFVLEEIGYGAGAREFKERPNCLRVMIGGLKEDFLQDSVFVIEANIDDMNPVDYEYLIEKLFKEGALDAYLLPVQMKKMRPGVLLTVLAGKDCLDRLSSVIFSESTTIGVRYYEARRKKLKREFLRVNTKYGDVRVKVSSGPKGIKKVVAEYADCKRIADSKNIPLNQIRKEIEKVAQDA